MYSAEVRFQTIEVALDSLNLKYSNLSAFAPLELCPLALNPYTLPYPGLPAGHPVQTIQLVQVHTLLDRGLPSKFLR